MSPYMAAFILESTHVVDVVRNWPQGAHTSFSDTLSHSCHKDNIIHCNNEEVYDPLPFLYLVFSVNVQQSIVSGLKERKIQMLIQGICISKHCSPCESAIPLLCVLQKDRRLDDGGSFCWVNQMWWSEQLSTFAKTYSVNTQEQQEKQSREFFIRLTFQLIYLKWYAQQMGILNQIFHTAIEWGL